MQVHNILGNSVVDELNWEYNSIPNISNGRAQELSLPSTYREAMVSVNNIEWVCAINEEIESMKTEEVFTEVNLNDALK
ncbi:hypothetical protein O181_013810 [Austropuccinia psidii MF-1]|uniref:Uncharacterized protein n=1 Tax=Austropuccinia psidii MF-1 TaxID=1389203 RepID=A0A9Q3BZT1_9BASI|nr:hypothetical protein [Austropuccinia psidii MF-1]